jgi:3'(2'), 5'-bisphosphate nucleotidase
MSGVFPDMDAGTRNDIAMKFGDIASRAGQVIMAIYENGLSIAQKADGSPVTEADVRAEHLIRDELSRLLPSIDIIAEESFAPHEDIQVPEQFLLVDPLDGTREFISRNGEFTVNIALIEGGVPIVGCVYAPARARMYVAGVTAFRAELRPSERMPLLAQLERIATRAYPPAGLTAVASRSHLDSQTEAFLARLSIAARQNAGSSLKFCAIAQSDADVYPRLAPTMEWDTAAGQAVLAAAGGCVVGTDGKPLCYGKSGTGFRNDGFVAWGQAPLLDHPLP